MEQLTSRPLRATLKVSSQYLLICLILGFTTAFTPAKCPLRMAALAIILALAISIQTALHVPFLVQGFLALGAWAQVFNSLDVLIHKRIIYAAHRKDKNPIMFGDAVWFALSVPNNFRRIGTQWQISPVYSFDAGLGKIPSRRKFLQERLQSLAPICCASVLFFLIPSYPDWIPQQEDLGAVLHQDTHLLRRPQISQISVTFCFILATNLLLKSSYNLFSIIAVSLRLSSPAHWPPFQASAGHAWSVRRFWGKFWHQSLRSLLTSNADFILSMSPLRPKTAPYRYVRYFLCFFISGLIHCFFDLAMGISPRETGALLFFAVQPAAFAVEDVARSLSKRYGVLTEDTAARRLIGYLWVVMFSIWSWRPWAYPILRRTLEAWKPMIPT